MIPLLLVAEASKLAAEASKIVPRVELDPHAEESYYAIARLLLRISRSIVDFFGLSQSSEAFTIVYALLVFVVSFGVGMLIQAIVVFLVHRIGRHWKSPLYAEMISDHFFTKASRIIPALFFLILIQFTLYSRVNLAGWLTRLTWIYVIVLIAVAFSSIANITWNHIDRKENTRRLPLKGIVQLVKGIVWLVSVIVILAILFNKSPGSLLAGLGAFAAVLMLIFKDSILGVVAGVQLSENDSLHVGDWIKAGDANGVVTEVSLTSVKILNFDKTVTTLPPYSLVSSGFTNMRNMQLSDTRRIERCYMIDADSVVPTDESMLDEFARIPLLTDWIARKRAQRAAGKVEDVFNSEGLADGSLESNLGIFRAYVKLYLDAHPHVAHGGDGNDCFVRTLQQTSSGIPLQLYCFTSTSKWVPYEAIMCQIMEHVAVMLYRFNLCTFENPSSRDTIAEGYVEGKNPDVLFGAPMPFLKSDAMPPSVVAPAGEKSGEKSREAESAS